MADDTAVLEAPPETTIPAEAPEKETEEHAEQVAETGAEEDAETEEPRLTEAEVTERIATREREVREEIQTAENTRQYTAQWNQSRVTIEQDLPNRITNLVKWAADQFTEHGTSDEVVRNLAAVVTKDIAVRAADAWFAQEWAVGANHLVKTVGSAYPEWRPSQETSQLLTRAVQSGNPENMARARLAYIQAAVRESEVPKAVKAELDKLNDSKTKAQRTAELQATKQRERPASGGGSAAGGRAWKTQLEVDTALSKGEIDWPTAKAALAKDLPYS